MASRHWVWGRTSGWLGSFETRSLSLSARAGCSLPPCVIIALRGGSVKTKAAWLSVRELGRTPRRCVMKSMNPSLSSRGAQRRGDPSEVLRGLPQSASLLRNDKSTYCLNIGSCGFPPLRMYATRSCSSPGFRLLIKPGGIIERL